MIHSTILNNPELLFFIARTQDFLPTDTHLKETYMSIVHNSLQNKLLASWMNRFLNSTYSYTSYLNHTALNVFFKYTLEQCRSSIEFCFFLLQSYNQRTCNALLLVNIEVQVKIQTLFPFGKSLCQYMVEFRAIK